MKRAATSGENEASGEDKLKTYNDIYLSTRNILRQNGVEGYALEARILVACAAGKTVQQLLRDINLYTTEQVENTVLDYTARRLRGEPVAYITGSWEFYGLPMTVTPDVLIPRMDTEVLVDAVKEFLTGYKMDARVLDLCCGSGCITCAIGHELPATSLSRSISAQARSRSAGRTSQRTASARVLSACRRTRQARPRSALAALTLSSRTRRT